jgi:TonB family protein
MFLMSTLHLASGAQAQGPPPPAERKRVDLLLNDPRLGARDTSPPRGDFAEVRRGIVSRFRPTRPMITEDSKPSLALRQLHSNPVPQSPPGRKVSTDENVEVQEAAEDAHRAYERPTRARSVDVAITLDARGRIAEEKVEQTSGSSRFDAAALEAVHASIADADIGDEGRAVVVRFRIRAGYGVTLPRAMPLLAPRVSSGRVPANRPTIPMPFSTTFDESRGKVQVKPAFEDKFDVDVTLLSVSPIPPNPPPSP